MWTGYCDIRMVSLNLWSNHFWLLDLHLVSDSYFKFPFLHWIVLSWLLNICHIILFDPCWRADLIKWFMFKFRSIAVSVLLTVFNWLSETRLYFFSHMRSWNWFVVASTIVCIAGCVCWIDLAVLFVKHGFGWRTEVYVLLYGEETDVSKTFHLQFL